VPLGKVAVAIVEDDERFRLYLQEILNQSRKFHCVGSYSSGEEALMGIPQSGAQVVFMDQTSVKAGFGLGNNRNLNARFLAQVQP
jgi:DNA-binding NarL/FixJ family response regulator